METNLITLLKNSFRSDVALIPLEVCLTRHYFIHDEKNVVAVKSLVKSPFHYLSTKILFTRSPSAIISLATTFLAI